ncbi:DUF4190 domain-containing protein [Curtobacterium sp. ME12]|uniref:DUF4190 domain-containing protein n=1 Tax=Curtobacterium sp. ME12 TaxID=2744253 RepID=UPI0015F4BB1E|nr:DUF4190 domain-containing protein [Curtobacterium sp. ME12]
MSDATPSQPNPYNGNAQPYQQSPGQSDRYSVLAIVGFILAFVVSIGGLIVSIIALTQIKRTGERGRGLALAGIIISAASIVLSIVFAIVIFAAAANAPSYSGY